MVPRSNVWYDLFKLTLPYPILYCSNSRMHTLSEYGKGRVERSRFGYTFYCDGTEDNLRSCAKATVSCSSTTDVVALDCSNTGTLFLY